MQMPIEEAVWLMACPFRTEAKVGGSLKYCHTTVVLKQTINNTRCDLK
jgi:hypothetical protein